MSTKPAQRCPFERIQNPDLKAEQIAETAEITVQLLDTRYPPPKQILRGVHPESHGCVKATFTINPDIKPELQVGLFAEPGKQFDAFIRFSNASTLVGPDTTEKKLILRMPLRNGMMNLSVLPKLPFPNWISHKRGDGHENN